MPSLSLSALLLSTVATAAPIRVCGQDSQVLDVYATPTTLDALGLRLAEGVAGDAPVTVLSAAPLAPSAARAASLAAAAALGYRVRPWRRAVRLPRADGAASATASVLFLDDSGDADITVRGHRFAAWTDDAGALAPYAALAQQQGVQRAITDPDPMLPQDDTVRDLLGVTSEIPMARIFTEEPTAEAHIWMGTVDQLCDTLAQRQTSLFLLEGSGDHPLTLAALQPIPAADALDVLSAIAPAAGMTIREGAGVVYLDGSEAASEGEATMAMIVPAGSNLMGLTPESVRSTSRLLATSGLFGIATRSGGAAMIMGDPEALAHLAAPRPSTDAERSAERDARLAERDARFAAREAEEAAFQANFVANGDTVSFPREAASSLATGSIRGLVRQRDDDGTVEALVIERRLSPLSPLHGMGLERGDVLLSWDGGPLDSAAALQAMLGAVLTEPTVQATVSRSGAKRTLTWQISGAPIPGVVPEPTLSVDLAEARYQAAVVIDGDTVRLPRAILSDIAAGTWNGSFRVTHDGLHWKASGRGYAGLGLLLEPSDALATHRGAPLTEDAQIQALLAALFTEDTVEFGRADGSTLRLELSGPPLALPADLALPIQRPGVLSVAQRCQELTQQVRAIPHKDESGELDGFRLSAIRRSSPLDTIGLKNGDIVTGIDDTTLAGTSPEQMSGAFAALLQEPGAHTIAVVRRANAVVVSFQIEAGACPAP